MSESGNKRRLESDADESPYDEYDNEQEQEDTEDPLSVLTSMFPDCDPHYIENRINWHGRRKGVVGIICDELIGHQYPLMKDRQAMERQLRRKTQLDTVNFSAAEFLRIYRHPDGQFKGNTSVVTNEYKCHSMIALHNDFPRLKTSLINNVLQSNCYHYFSSYRHLNDVYKEIKDAAVNGDIRLRFTDRSIAPLPMEPCELFYHERWFTHNEKLIRDHELAHASRLSDAIAQGESMTCNVCMSEVLYDDLVSCREGHQYCRECVASTAQFAIESGNSRVTCLELSCSYQYPMWLIETLLPPRLCGILDRRYIEQDVIEFAEDIDDLVVCPFCPFAAVMPNIDDKVFHCRNPDCLRTSCRYRCPDWYKGR